MGLLQRCHRPSSNSRCVTDKHMARARSPSHRSKFILRETMPLCTRMLSAWCSSSSLNPSLSSVPPRNRLFGWPPTHSDSSGEDLASKQAQPARTRSRLPLGPRFQEQVKRLAMRVPRTRPLKLQT
eukprot:UN22444